MKPTNRQVGRPPKHVGPFAEWIKKRGLKREDVAKKLAIGLAHLNRICRGERGASVDIIAKIEKLTDGAITAEDLRPTKTKARATRKSQ